MNLLEKARSTEQKGALGATIRTVSSFTSYFSVLLLVGILIGMVETPNILTNLPSQIPQILAIISVLTLLVYVFEAKLSTYGMAFNTDWFVNMFGGILIGIIYQAFSTFSLIQLGDASIIDSWQSGVFNSGISVSLAVLSTVIAFSIVAIGEDLLFRGILIREIITGLEPTRISSKNSSAVAILLSSLIFGFLHIGAGATGLSTTVVVLQAVIGGIYFGIAYVISNSLALPIGIHLSTNVWTKIVFGEVDSGYPMLFTLERNVSLEPSLLISLVLPSVLLVLCVVVWINVVGDQLDVRLETKYK